MDVLIETVLTTMLPAEGEPFPRRDRERMLRALEANFDVVYGAADAETESAR